MPMAAADSTTTTLRSPPRTTPNRVLRGQRQLRGQRPHHATCWHKLPLQSYGRGGIGILNACSFNQPFFGQGPSSHSDASKSGPLERLQCNAQAIRETRTVGLISRSGWIGAWRHPSSKASNGIRKTFMLTQTSPSESFTPSTS